MPFPVYFVIKGGGKKNKTQRTISATAGGLDCVGEDSSVLISNFTLIISLLSERYTKWHSFYKKKCLVTSQKESLSFKNINTISSPFI